MTPAAGAGTKAQDDQSVEVLLVEKQLHHAEKLSVIQAIKQSYAILGVVSGLLLSAAYGDGVHAAHLVVPYVVLVSLFFVLSNSLVLLLIGEHLRGIDEALAARVPGLPTMWQQDVGSAMADWGPTIKAGRARALNPYFGLATVVVFLGVGMTVVSLVESWLFLEDEHGQLAAALYVGPTSALVLVAAAAAMQIVVTRVPLKRAGQESPVAEPDPVDSTLPSSTPAKRGRARR